MTTDMRYTVNIDAQQADAELAKIRSEVVTLAGQEQALTKATDAATASLIKHGDAAAKASPKVETFQQRVSKLPDLLGKQAAAISLVSSSLEGMGGNVGKAVAAAGQMAAAYGAGGPFALALVGGIAIIDKLTQYWKDLNDEEDRNIKLKFAVTDAAKSKTEVLKAELAELRKQADPEQARADVRKGIADEIRTLEITRDQLLRRAQIRGVTAEQAAFARTEAEQLDEQRKLLIEKLTLMAQIAAKSAPSTGGARTASAAVNVGQITQTPSIFAQGAAMLKQRADAEADAAIDSVRIEAERQHLVDIEVQRGLDYRAAAEEATRLASIQADDAAYARRLASTEAFYSGASAIAQQSAGVIAGTSTQLIADLISGQEKALEHFGVSVMAQAGQALVGYGVQAIGRGVLELSNPLTAPLAPVSFAAGGGLIAAGVGLGGVAGGLSGLMGAGSGGAARGASPRTSTGTTGAQAGPTQITYIFAPSRDEGAAAVALAGKHAESRQLNKTRTR